MQSGNRVIPSHYEIYIIQEQAEVVVLIFTLFCKGLGLSAIAKELNQKQIASPPRGYKRTGKKVNWASSTVRKILTNAKYIGHWDWGRTCSIYNPIDDKRVKKEVPRHLWHQHHDGKKIREDLIIVPIDLWNEAQKRFATSGRKYRERISKTEAMREIRSESTGGKTLLAGVLRCDQCGSRMIQITSGYYGCGMHHRKDRTQCSNKRLIKCRKVETKVIGLLKEILTRPSVIEAATKALNQKIKKRLSTAPSELKSLQKNQIDLEREIQNLLKFIMENGDTSHSVKSTLAEKEAEILFIKQQIQMLQSASADKLFVTPIALKERFDSLMSLLESDPVHANAALRRLIPQGLRCGPQSTTAKKNLNQNNSKWKVTGEILVYEPLCKDTAHSHFVEPNQVSVDLTI